jgi:hypothetical protein
MLRLSVIMLLLCFAWQSQAGDRQPVVRTSDSSTVTHKFKIGPITIGCSDQGGGYLNYVDIGNGRNIVSAKYGRGWQGSVRDQLHSGRYNPTQAGFTDTAGSPVHLIASEHGITIPAYNLPLYGDPVFDFTEHEDLVPDASVYPDNGNTDTDGLEESEWTQDDELRSEFDFEGRYEDATRQAGGTIPVLRFYSRYTYVRPPKAIRQFGKKAVQADGRPVINEAGRVEDISRILSGSQSATDNDLSQIIFTAYGMRLLTASGYTTPMWIDHGRWKSLPIEAINGRGKEKEFELGPSSEGRKAQTGTLDSPFLILAKGSDPDASPAIGFYTPPDSEINARQILGLDKNSGETVYSEDRRNRGVILFSRVIPSQVDIRSRFFLTGMLAPGHGKPDVLEALQNETFILFGTPNQIRQCVETLKKELQ